MKKVFLDFAKLPGKHLFQSENLAQVFSCECCKISKNVFFTEHLWWTASVKGRQNGEYIYKRNIQKHGQKKRSIH